MSAPWRAHGWRPTPVSGAIPVSSCVQPASCLPRAGKCGVFIQKGRRAPAGPWGMAAAQPDKALLGWPLCPV